VLKEKKIFFVALFKGDIKKCSWFAGVELFISIALYRTLQGVKVDLGGAFLIKILFPAL